MYWKTIDFFKLIKLLLPTFLRKNRIVIFLSCCIVPLNRVYNETLYKMQHDGRTIYLEKMLNEWFQIANYNPTNHDFTKMIIIDDLPELEKVFVFLDEEPGESFIYDDEFTDDDVFLDSETNGTTSYSWIVKIPNNIDFDIFKTKAQIDSYRYFGKKYKIETYEL